jgi:chromosome partitioning protein
MALAGTLAADGLRVAVVDADPNRAYTSWANEAYEGSKVDVRAEADEARLADAIDDLAPISDLVLIDTAGFGNRAALLAIAAADAVLVPCTPSRADIEQAAKTLQLIEGAARAARRPIPARVVPSRIKASTAVSKHSLAELDASELPRTIAALGDRVAFAEMTFSGRVPIVTSEAGQEIAILIAELRTLGWLPKEPVFSKVALSASL